MVGPRGQLGQGHAGGRYCRDGVPCPVRPRDRMDISVSRRIFGWGVLRTVKSASIFSHVTRSMHTICGGGHIVYGN